MVKQDVNVAQENEGVKGSVIFGSLTIGGSLLVGAIVAFLVGAHAGARLDHTTRNVSVGQAHPAAPVAQR